jgi:cytochrome c oxidase assembly factor CtaG
MSKLEIVVRAALTTGAPSVYHDIWGNVSFLGTALCFWWALLYRHQELQGYGVAVLAVFTTALHSSLLGALLTFAPIPWYPASAHTTAAWGLTHSRISN